MTYELTGADTMAAREHTGNLSYGPLTQRDEDFLAGVKWAKGGSAAPTQEQLNDMLRAMTPEQLAACEAKMLRAWAKFERAVAQPADWSDLPRDLYVTSVRRVDAVVWEASMCSVPMAVGPEVRYVRAAAPPNVAGLIAELNGWQETPGISDDARRKLYLMREAATALATLAADVRRLRDAILSARWRLAKGRSLWNGPCHECDAVLGDALKVGDHPISEAAEARIAALEAREIAPAESGMCGACDSPFLPAECPHRTNALSTVGGVVPCRPAWTRAALAPEPRR